MMSSRLNYPEMMAFLGAVADFSVGVSEICVFNASFKNNLITSLESYKRTMCGYYDRPDAIHADAIRLDGVSAYIVPNPAVRDLLARSANTISKVDKGKRTQDAHIVFLRWAFIDIDPERIDKGISATNGECGKALEVQDHILACHPEIKASALWGSSGNGAWILVRLPDYPNEPENRQYVERFIRTLHAKYSTPYVDVDIKSYTPSHLMCLPGTQKCKGSNIPDRPWRMATFASWALGYPTDVPSLELGKWLADNEVVGPLVPVIPIRASVRVGKSVGNVERRIEKWLGTKEPAIAYQHGSDKTFDVAMDLVQGWDLGVNAARPWMEQYNLTCLPPWTASDLERKLEQAEAKQDSQGRARGWLRDDGKFSGNQNDFSGNAYGIPDMATQPGQVEAVFVGPRQQIVVNHDILRVVNEAQFALAADSCVYQRTGQLVSTVRDTLKQRGLRIDKNDPRYNQFATPNIVPIENARIRELISKNADFIQMKMNREGESDAILILPPEWVATTLMARGQWTGIRNLHTIVEAPILRTDGTVLDVAGYDAETEILFVPNVEYDPIPENPSRKDAIEATERILELVDQFPFVSKIHRAAWLSALLTPFARFAIAGAVPLFLFDANNSGSGKTKLVDLISAINTGERVMPRSVFPEDDAEFRKNITSVALEGSRFVFIDNIEEGKPFGGSALDAALTATVWKDRVLNTNKRPTLPLFAIWYATGNNVQIKGDAARRFVYCRLQVDVERAEEREGFVRDPLEGWACENRPWLVRDCLTILRAFHLAGRPKIPCRPMDFPEWSALIRSAVWWVTSCDCWANHDTLRETDSNTSTHRAIVHGWRELPGQEKGLTSADMLKLVKESSWSYDMLRNALLEWSRSSELPTPRQVGNHLKPIRDRVFDGWCMQSVNRHGTQYWSVKSVEEGGSVGSASAVSAEPLEIPNFDDPPIY